MVDEYAGCGILLDAKKPLFGDTSFYTFNNIISGSCAAFACLVIFFCIFMHATHYSKPHEQSKYASSFPDTRRVTKEVIDTVLSIRPWSGWVRVSVS